MVSTLLLRIRTVSSPMARLTTFETGSTKWRLTSAKLCRRRIWWCEWLRAVSSPMPFTPTFITGRTTSSSNGEAFVCVVCVTIDLSCTRLILGCCYGRLLAPLEKSTSCLQNFFFSFIDEEITTWKSIHLYARCTTYAIGKHHKFFSMFRWCWDSSSWGRWWNYHYQTSRKF